MNELLVIPIPRKTGILTNIEEPLLEKEEKWTNIQIDSQILSTFMSCPCKVDYVFNRKLVPISGLSKSISKGQLVHTGAHIYWKGIIEGKDYQEASLLGVDAIKKEISKFPNIEADDALEVLSTIVKFFKFIQSSSWIPLFTEKHFRFLAYEDPSLRLRIYLTGRIDLGLKTPQVDLIPVDMKTESERWFYSQMSNQFKIYALACNSNILGVQRFGFQKSLEDKDKFKMEILSFDPDVLEEFRTITLPHYVKQLMICHEDKFWPMNSASCIHGHFACQFSDKYNGGICNISRNVREQKLTRYFIVGKDWNPEEVN